MIRMAFFRRCAQAASRLRRWGLVGRLSRITRCRHPRLPGLGLTYTTCLPTNFNVLSRGNCSSGTWAL